MSFFFLQLRNRLFHSFLVRFKEKTATCILSHTLYFSFSFATDNSIQFPL